MGKRYLRSIVRDFTTLTASADITPVDLPVNAVSHLILTLSLTKNVAAQVTGLGQVLHPIVQQITDVRITHRGENIIQGSLQDLMVMSAILTNQRPGIGEFAQADNQVQFVTIVIPFGRVLYSPTEAFPATMRGQFRFHMTAGAISSLYDAASWSLEAIELIEDSPTHFLKYTTMTRALAATGRQRMPLPIGNEILGVLLYDPSDEIDSTMEYTFGKVKLMRDNVEQYYGESNWESLRETMERRIPGYRNAWGHIHALAAADTDTGEEQVVTADQPPLQYGYMDFDPLKDGYYSLETEGASALDLDLSADVGSGTVRILPVEYLPIRT